MSDQPHFKVELDGLEVVLTRSAIDGRLLVMIDSHDTGEVDRHPIFGVPKLRLMVNDHIADLDENGDWIEAEELRADRELRKR